MHKRYILDTRRNKVRGPYAKGEAELYAKDLNGFIERDGVIAFPFVAIYKTQLTLAQRAEILFCMRS